MSVFLLFFCQDVKCTGLFHSRCPTSVCSAHYQANITQSDGIKLTSIDWHCCSTGGHFWPSSMPPPPHNFSTSCHRLVSSFGSLTPSYEYMSVSLHCVCSTGSLRRGGGKHAARVVVSYMGSLSGPTESSVPVKESSWGHCGRTSVTYETRGALWIMHKRDCFYHENVGFGPDVRMILLLLFF